ncbi:MBL fold metallo-hydrolase [Bacillus sp. AK128]
MYIRNLLTLFCIFTIFFISGCTQEPNNINNTGTDTDTVEQESTGDLNESEDKGGNSTPPEKQKENIDTEIVDDPNEAPNNLSELKVHYMDVGQADSTLFQYSHEGEDYTILIDAGNWNRSDVVNYLIAQNISQIDIAIGTHPDADHIGQLDKVLNTMDVGEVWLSGNTNPSQTFQRVIRAIDASGADYYEPRMGDEFEIGPLKIDVLYPSTISEDDNDESISMMITYGEIRFIFTGDASTGDEINMLNSGFNMQADILQLGHHGSSTSTHPTFLSEVNPSVAIYSAGLDNSYGHPHNEVVELIQSSGIELYGTDVHGTIIVTTDGVDYNVLTKHHGTISPQSSNDTVTKKESKSEPKSPTNSCIDVNSASIEQVQEIIHIGPARAEDLVNLRPFHSIDDLTRISGIGPSRVKDINAQGLACIGG